MSSNTQKYNYGTSDLIKPLILSILENKFDCVPTLTQDNVQFTIQTCRTGPDFNNLDKKMYVGLSNVIILAIAT
jgi:hypothetical protein